MSYRFVELETLNSFGSPGVQMYIDGVPQGECVLQYPLKPL